MCYKVSKINTPPYIFREKGLSFEIPRCRISQYNAFCAIGLLVEELLKVFAACARDWIDQS
jgi:hypothetical protein